MTDGRTTPARPGGVSAEELSSRGGEGDGYTWSQEADEVEILFELPAGTAAKDVAVRFLPDKVVLTAPVSQQLALFARAVPDDCSWQLSDGKLLLTLGKEEEGQTWLALTR